jgi:hypothetical protein
MSNVIGSIWRNLKKRKKCISSLPILNFEPRNGYVVAGDIFHGPQEWRFLVAALDAILDVEKTDKSLSILYRNKEKLSFIVNDNTYFSGSINLPKSSRSELRA